MPCQLVRVGWFIVIKPSFRVGVERVDPAQHESMQKKGKTAYNSASKDQWIPDFPFLVSAKEMQGMERVHNSNNEGRA